jgi:hypothetical protein
MATGSISSAVIARLRRDASDPDDTEDPDTGQKEIFSSYALLILILLLIVAFFTSYILRSKKIQAVHETVISIFAGMVVGLILRLTVVTSVLDAVSFDYQFFFNLLLPPIILASGYELHQVGHVDTANSIPLLTELSRQTSSATLERFSLSHLLEPSYLHWSWAVYYGCGLEFRSRG